MDMLTAHQGNLSTQRQVTIFDPIHDSVRAVLESRYADRAPKCTCSWLNVFMQTIRVFDHKAMHDICRHLEFEWKSESVKCCEELLLRVFAPATLLRVAVAMAIPQAK